MASRVGPLFTISTTVSLVQSIVSSHMGHEGSNLLNGLPADTLCPLTVCCLCCSQNDSLNPSSQLCSAYNPPLRGCPFPTVKAKVLTMATGPTWSVPCDFSVLSSCSLYSLLTLLQPQRPLCYSSTNYAPTSGPLYLPFLLPEMLFSQEPSSLAFSLPLRLPSDVTFSLRSSLMTLFKSANFSLLYFSS